MHDVLSFRSLESPRPFQALDTVIWERDGGSYTGMIREIRGDLAFVMSSHGGEPMVYTKDLRLIIGREKWDEEALRNHLWAVYGLRA